MPHSKSGKPMRVGDVIVGKEGDDRVVALVASITPAASSCNMRYVPLARVWQDGERRVAIHSPSTGQLGYGTCGEWEILDLGVLDAPVATPTG